MTATTLSARLTKSQTAVSQVLAGRGWLVAVVGLFACGLFAFLPAELGPEGWYSFLGGDVVVHHGLPAHNALTVWGHGRRWVDQQWLAQLFYYGLFATGGLRLALLANAAIVAASFAAAVALGRRRGGSGQMLLLVAVLAALVIGFSASALRPQTLALPLFVGVAWLLVSNAREPSRRVFLTIPLLAVWANLHGSVTLGAALVVLAAATDMWAGRALRSDRLVLAIGAVLAPFASPYAAHLGGYYRTILFNREFAKYLPGWIPTSLSPRTLGFYVLAFGALAALARAPRVLSLFERVALVLLLSLGVVASQGVTWFCLFALIVLPTAATSFPLPRRSLLPARFEVIAAVAAVAAAVAAAAAGAIRPGSELSSGYPDSVARTVAAAAGPEGRVFSNHAYADWLLLVEPSLRGRIAYDSRFELLPKGRLADAAAASIARWDAQRILRPFDVVVQRRDQTELPNALLRTGHWHRVPVNADVVVLSRLPS